MAMNKPVLLLKDKTVTTLQADLAGKLYRPFDPHDPEDTNAQTKKCRQRTFDPNHDSMQHP